MIRLLPLLLLLAACGVDGAPVPPSKAKAVAPAVTISGTAEIGIARRF